MIEVSGQQNALALALISVGAILATLLLVLMARSLRRRGTDRSVPPLSDETPAKPDAAAVSTLIRAAETDGRSDDLPGMYLSLAQLRLETGERAEAEELLRKSLHQAGSAQNKTVHAKARLALGDLAHAGGDLTTACEHWQIARALFFELKQRGDHEAVEQRMQRNGCPTDWVLTDF